MANESHDKILEELRIIKIALNIELDLKIFIALNGLYNINLAKYFNQHSQVIHKLINEDSALGQKYFI